MMGNSLHNKIHLGRTSMLESARWRVLLTLGACAGIGLAVLALVAWR